MPQRLTRVVPLGLAWLFAALALGPASNGKDAPAKTPEPAAPAKDDADEPTPKEKDKGPRAVPASDVTEKAQAFASKCQCKTCGGDGVVETEKVVRDRSATPPRNDGAIFRPTKKVTGKAACKTCSGTGLAAEPLITKAGVNLLRSLDRVDASDPKAPERFEAALEHLSKATKSTRGWATRINTPALKRLTGMNPKKGEYILLVGRIKGVRDGAAGREHIVKFGELKTAVLPSAKTYKAVQDQVVLVGGTLREVRLHDDVMDIEIEGGFVVEAAAPENEEF